MILTCHNNKYTYVGDSFWYTYYALKTVVDTFFSAITIVLTI